MFIVLEGADGSGKTALAAEVMDQLRRSGHRVRATRRADPDGPAEHAALIRAVGQMFARAGDQGTGFDLLSLAAAAQYAAIVHGQVLPAVRRGEIVIADSWWAKTWVRLSIEASYRAPQASPGQVGLLRSWQQALWPCPPLSPIPALTVLIDAPQADRMHWYEAAGRREPVYDACGASTRNPAAFAHLTSAIADLLRQAADQQGWPIIANGRHLGLQDVAADVIAAVTAQPLWATHRGSTACSCA
ncbi:hypothetical protein [Sphaerisporangium album]|uniref:hypothetical protein n=1 Tax=Sphaerisporangium album TaxID=509200 RepID=UPI0015F002AA|nr:hypothetical protein [Sphaerisporangium album]